MIRATARFGASAVDRSGDVEQARVQVTSGASMFAVGCLLLIILPLAGFLLGLSLGNETIALWCAFAGFAIALAACGTSIYALVKSGRRS